MAKSDSFFIRAEVDTGAGVFTQTEIDLGSFVNLGVSKSTLLRIHNVSVQYLDESSTMAAINETATNSKVTFQLTSQTQTAIVYASNKSVISSGGLDIFTDGTRTIFVGDSPDINPQAWTHGYLIGVDSIFWGAVLVRPSIQVILRYPLFWNAPLRMPLKHLPPH